MGDRDIVLTHHNKLIRKDLEKNVSKEIAKFEQSNTKQDWAIEDLEAHFSSKNYTVIFTVRVNPEG